MRRNGMRRMAALCLGGLVLCMGLFVPVHARTRLDASKTGSIALTYPVGGISFSLYQIGEMDVEGTLSFTEEYAQYPLSLEIETQSEWQALADTLDMIIERDGLSEADAVLSDAEGNASFENVSVGLYLIRWESHVTDGMQYTAKPVLITVPGLDAQDAWVYDVTPVLKYGVEEVEEEKMDLRIHKVWEDDQDSYEKRPATITVELLLEGDVVETVVLSEENAWTYVWEDLDASKDWKVSESVVPQEYTMTVTKEGNTVLITNRIRPDIPEEPEEPDNPPQLPKTGMLWWPVPVLAAGGIALILIGLLSKNRKAQ